MSQENVELVRAYIAAYNAGGEAFADSLGDFMAEDVEIVPDASRFTEARPFRGREKYRRYIADIDQDWEGGGRLEIREIVPAGNDRVVTWSDWGGRGRASGIDLRSSLSSISTVRGGKTKVEFFNHGSSKPPGWRSRQSPARVLGSACRRTKEGTQ